MRRLTNPTPYSVRIAPEAWKAVGKLHAEVHFKILEELRRVANARAEQRETLVPGTTEEVHSLLIEDHTVHYAVDLLRRTITLLDVRPTSKRPR